MPGSYRRRRMDLWLARLAEVESSAAVVDLEVPEEQIAHLEVLRSRLVGSALAGLPQEDRIDVYSRAMAELRGIKPDP